MPTRKERRKSGASIGFISLKKRERRIANIIRGETCREKGGENAAEAFAIAGQRKKKRDKIPRIDSVDVPKNRHGCEGDRKKEKTEKKVSGIKTAAHLARSGGERKVFHVRSKGLA